MDYKITVEGKERDDAITWARRNYNKANLQNTKKTNEEFLNHMVESSANQWVNERRAKDTTELAAEIMSALVSGDDEALDACMGKAKSLKAPPP